MSKEPYQSRSRENELPYSQYPCLSFPSFYYKTKNKMDTNHCFTLVGLQIHIMKRSEQDHLLYLLQIFNSECPRVKIHVIPPSLIYAEFKIDIDEDEEEKMQAIELQGKLFELLMTTRQCFGKFINERMKEKYMVSTMFQSESFVDTFRQEVVKKVKEREICMFDRLSQKKL